MAVEGSKVWGLLGVERRSPGRDSGIAVLAALVGATRSWDEFAIEGEMKRTSDLEMMAVE